MDPSPTAQDDVHVTFPSDGGRNLLLMTLCFIEPHETVRAVADSLSTEARHQLMCETLRAWADCLPDSELDRHYARVVTDLEEDEVTMLAAWHATLNVGTPIASRDFLVGAFGALGEHRREALRIAAGFHGPETVGSGLSLEDLLEHIVPWLDEEPLKELEAVALEIYVWDRLGTEN